MDVDMAAVTTDIELMSCSNQQKKHRVHTDEQSLNI